VWQISSGALRAQGDDIIVSIIIPPPYSPYLQDYLQYENKMVIQLQSLSTQTLSVKLIGSIEGDNGIALRTDPDYMPSKPITLLPNSLLRIPASSGSRAFFDPNNVTYEGPEDLKMKILKDGILPEGTYTICLQAVDYQTNIPLSAEAPSGCALLPISYPTPPQMVSPECEGTTDAQLPFFQWTLPGGNTGNASLVYDLYIVEWLSGSNPQDLMQLAIDYNAGNAIVKTNLNSPIYQYQPTDIKLIKGKTYLWSVRVRDRMNTITFENMGQSEICSFTIGNPFDDTAEQYIVTGPNGSNDIEIVQTRTLVKGKLLYKFPGETSTGWEAVNRSLSMETGDMPFTLAEESPFQLSVMEQPVAALTPKNYFNPFPVLTIGSQPLENISVKLIESWVITDCNVTYVPSDPGEASWTVFKDVFILPDDYLITYPGNGGRTLEIQGLTNNGPGGDNPLNFGMVSGAPTYNRVLAVGRTDGQGNFSFRFTQSTPGLNFLNYPNEAVINLVCGSGEVESEWNDFVHPLDIVSNPADQISNPADQLSNPSDILENPSGIGLNQAVQMQGIQGENQIPSGGQQTLRSGVINPVQGQQGYNQVQINGGHLYKVLRLEVASPFYYSPDLIFWTHPGDTLTLPDQVSYVKSFNLDLKVYAGDWNGNAENQVFTEGDPVPNIDVLYSRKKAGLPAEIPIEEGQGLRDYEGESSNDSDWIEEGEMNLSIDVDNVEYDSVSVLETLGEGNAFYHKLVTGHAYYVQGNAPLDDGVNYNVPMTTKIYHVFESQGCDQNLEANLNSFCQHQPIYIQDALLAFPQAPRVFGFVTTSTDADKGPLPEVLVTLRGWHNNQLVHSTTTYSDWAGNFQFNNLPVNEGEGTPYAWRIYFKLNGYADQHFPEDTLKTMVPGQQWDLEDIEMVPLGLLAGIIQDEDGKPIQALVRLADGPHVQTTIETRPMGLEDFCGDVNGFGDAMDAATRLHEMYQMNDAQDEMISQNAASFKLPAQSGNNRRLVIIPLPEQYFQDTCIIDVDEVPFDQVQMLGKIIVKEKLHRVIIHVKGPSGENVQARISIDDHVRQTNTLGTAAFRYASPEINYRIRIYPDLATLVPVDSIISIPISKEYIIRNFNLKEGRKLKVVVIRDQSGQQQQSENPIPLAGVTVQTLLSSSPTGNSYIECITGADGVCTLEGVPTASPFVDVTAWKEDDTQLIIGKTVSVSTTRPLNPPFTIALKVLSNRTMPDIWGFPVTITDADFVQGQGGTMDTLFEGFLIELPENARFKSRDDDVRIPFPKIKFKSSGQRDEDGRKIMEPVANGITLQQTGAEITLFDQFDVVLKPTRTPNGTSMNKLSLKKVGQSEGKIEGVVQAELSSFNWSYDFTGKFYLGKTPTEYNITVFNTGIPFYQAIQMNALIMGQEPTPGPDDFYLLDIGPGNRPQSHQFRIFQFEASSDSSRSFVSSEAFYIHTILHTDIDFVTPRDLKLSVGKIVVKTETIESPANNDNNLDFKMGKLWRYYSTSPFRYDPELGGITVTHGFIQTGQIDVPVSNPIIKPDKLIMSGIGDINSLTLSGIKDLDIMDGVNIVLSKGNYFKGWKLSVRKLDSNGKVIPNGVVAEIKGLPLLRPLDVIQIRTILLNSESDDLDLTLVGEVRPYDIADFSVSGITTGPGYFILDGTAILGREDVRVPGLGLNTMWIKYQGANQNLTGEIVTNFVGTFETEGQVAFKMDGNTANSIKQSFAHKNFLCHGELRVYEAGGEFKLNAILEVKYSSVKIHVIHEDLDIGNIENIDYTKADQYINFGGSGKRMLVRSGKQETSSNDWQALSFKANMDNFNGINPEQPPITFVVTGDVNATNANLEVDNIEINLGFAEIILTYDFEDQSLFGSMDFNPEAPIIMGPVSVDQIQAQIYVEPEGFLFSALIDGSICAGAFNTRLGLLLGSHTDVPQSIIDFTMQYARNQNPPATFADRELNGFFITGRIDLIDAPMTEVNFGFFGVSGGAEVGFDARFSMDFSQNGDMSFDFAALAFAGVMVEAWVLIPPVPCLDPTICLAANIELLLEASLQKSGGQWEMSGHGCGSIAFSGSICGISDSFSGKVDILFSSEHDPEIDAELGATCGGNSPSEYSCD
jgi:hypothetical protein